MTDNHTTGPEHTTSDPKPALVGMTLGELRQAAESCGLRSFTGGQIADWIYNKRVRTIEEMTNISLKGRAIISGRYRMGLEAPITVSRSSDGTVKYLFPGVGGRDIESVYIPDRDRATLCVSSQAGCRMGCKFCMTGRGGWQGDLTSNAIINQVLSVENSQSLTNIVFMGMGEPLDNVDAVLKAIEILTAGWGLGWSPKRITVSTVGRLDTLRRLLDETRVHVALSVHSPFGDERAALMPVQRPYPLTDVLALLRRYDWTHQRRLSMEYIMWQGLNDDMRHADALARMLRGMHSRVNLIRFHSFDGFDHGPADPEQMVRFRDRLNDQGITATIRASRGEDILAACGQLAGRRLPE